jgi:hypothetical protein
MPASVVGSFAEPGGAAAAIRALRAGGFTVRAVMPAPYPEVVAAIGQPGSAVDRVVLPGALAGLMAGAALVAWTSLDWPLATGGQPIVAFPPLVIIGFEVAVLAGAVASLAALVSGIRHGGEGGAFPPDARCDGDRIAVAAGGGDAGLAERLLLAGGAEGVHRAG